MKSAAVISGRLKHSWLENQILNKMPDVVVLLRHGAGWPALERFLDDANEAVELADKVEFGFSPAMLVDNCAQLDVLLKEQRDSLREAVHDAYKQYFNNVDDVSIRLRKAAQDMQKALSDLMDEWNKSDDAVSDDVLRDRWNTVIEKAEILRDVLDALPKGIVLP